MAKTKKRSGSYGIYIGVLFGIVVVLSAAFIVVPTFFPDTYNVAKVKSATALSAVKNTLAGSVDSNASSTAPSTDPSVTHIPTPKAVKGIYMTACAASTPSYRTRLTKLIDDTELNSVVIDIKDYSGALSFTPDDPTLAEYTKSGCPVKDMKELIEMLHQKNIYVIGRITTFQDPLFTKLHPDSEVVTASTGAAWTDRKGIRYIDPSSHEAWEHIVAIAKASYAEGFDELNFDYIRFPSDGNMQDIAFPWTKSTPKAQALETFFNYLHSSLQGTGVVISADLFGMTTTAEDDMGIGQVLESALPYFDYIDPMVYPSHYPATFNGWQNPNAHPYDLIDFVMASAVRRAEATSTPIKTLNATLVVPYATNTPARYVKPIYDPLKLRPWLQDFDLGTPDYGAAEVDDQIKATYAVGLNSWLLWDASNQYTPSALKPQ